MLRNCGSPVLVSLLVALVPSCGWSQKTVPEVGNSALILKAPVRITRSIRVAPGVYTVAAPPDGAVIEIAADNVVLDLSGVTLLAPPTEPWNRQGVGIRSSGHSHVTVTKGRISGYRVNVQLAAGTGLGIEGSNVGASRAQRLRSTPDHYDDSDWVDIFHLAAWQNYGAGLWLQDATDVTVQHVVADGAQNGIVLVDVHRATVQGNQASHNSGWGIALFRSSDNRILGNHADWNVRCESASYSHGCDSAGVLLMEGSNRNTLVDNTFSHSGDGYFSSRAPAGSSSDDNVVAYNDGSDSPHNAFESTFTSGDQFVGNTADRSDYGFWLGFSRETTVIGNRVVGSRHDGIAIEHGSGNRLLHNQICDSKGAGIRLFRRGGAPDPSRNYVLLRNVICGNGTGLVIAKSQQVTVVGNRFENNGRAIDTDAASDGVDVHANRIRPR